ncbi:MAG: hypothetical protein QM752_07690 [Gammaproteobacteria bacterium]
MDLFFKLYASKPKETEYWARLALEKAAENQAEASFDDILKKHIVDPNLALKIAAESKFKTSFEKILSDQYPTKPNFQSSMRKMDLNKIFNDAIKLESEKSLNILIDTMMDLDKKGNNRTRKDYIELMKPHASNPWFMGNMGQKFLDTIMVENNFDWSEDEWGRVSDFLPALLTINAFDIFEKSPYKVKGEEVNDSIINILLTAKNSHYAWNFLTVIKHTDDFLSHLSRPEGKTSICDFFEIIKDQSGFSILLWDVIKKCPITIDEFLEANLIESLTYRGMIINDFDQKSAHSFAKEKTEDAIKLIYLRQALCAPKNSKFETGDVKISKTEAIDKITKAFGLSTSKSWLKSDEAERMRDLLMQRSDKNGYLTPYGLWYLYHKIEIENINLPKFCQLIQQKRSYCDTSTPSKDDPYYTTFNIFSIFAQTKSNPPKDKEPKIPEESMQELMDASSWGKSQ